MNKVVIFGASGHGKVIADIFEQSNGYSILGFIDSFKKRGTKVLDYSVLGSEKDLASIAGGELVKGIVGIGDNWTRKQMVNKILKIKPNFEFVNAIHPKAIISKHSVIGAGVVIVGGAIVNPDVEIGDHSIINTNSSVGHDTVMGKYSSVGPGVTLGGNVSLGELSAIGIGAVVRNDIIIGVNTVVGSNSLVNTDLDDNVIAYGNPSKIVGKRDFGDPYL